MSSIKIEINKLLEITKVIMKYCDPRPELDGVTAASIASEILEALNGIESETKCAQCDKSDHGAILIFISSMVDTERDYCTQHLNLDKADVICLDCHDNIMLELLSA